GAASGRLLWRAMAACMASTTCASSMPPSCRRSRAAISMRRPSCWQKSWPMRFAGARRSRRRMSPCTRFPTGSRPSARASRSAPWPRLDARSACACIITRLLPNLQGDVFVHEQGRNSLWRDFTAGTTAVVPVLLGVVPYALIAGVIAIQVGLTPVQASGMSLLLFAGASQFAAMQLINNGAPALVILVTVLFVNLRMAMYSASIAPHFATTRQTTRALISYLLTDQAYMFSLYGFEQLAPARSRVAYYLGLA